VHPSLPVRSVRELVQLAKAQPGQLTYGTPGVATGIHLTTEYFSSIAGLKLVHVPYKGSSAVMVDLVGGSISTAFSTFSTTREQLKSQRLRALAIAAGARSKDFPQVPTMSEAGYPGFEASTWHGVIARGDTQGAIVALLNREIARILQTEDVRSTLLNAGLDVGAGSAEDFRRFVAAEIEKWRKVAAAARIRLD
jgi:tripartite-type tricarboxylate transporter receptor subunit TctC